MGSRLAAFFILVTLNGAVSPPCRAADAPLSGCRWEAMARRSPGFVVATARHRAVATTNPGLRLAIASQRQPESGASAARHGGETAPFSVTRMKNAARREPIHDS